MTLRLIPLTLIAMLIVVFQNRSEATTPPESRELVRNADREHPVAPGLEQWLADYSGRESVLAANDKDFASYLESRKGYTRAYLEMARANEKADQATALATAKKVRDFLQSEQLTSKPASAQHPLLPYMFLEMARTEGVDDTSLSYALAGVAEYGGGTCAQKQLIYGDLTREKLAKIDAKTLTTVFEDVSQFRSSLYKKSVLRRILDYLPREKRESVKEPLLAAAKDQLSVVSSYSWLRDWVEDDEFSALTGAQKDFFSAKRHARYRRCTTAKTSFLSAIASDATPETLAKAMDVAGDIEACYRRRGSVARRNFWKHIEKPMEKAFGFDGWAETQLRIGYLYWTADIFKDAKAYFDRVKTQAVAAKNNAIEARAVFALARVAENEGEFDEATKYYHDYVTRFDAGENYEEALQALVLLHVDKKAWREALAPLKKIIADQSKLDVDDRSVGSLSFALYWAGRIYYQLEDPQMASEMWRRASSEFYSTFYGAISHYLHEKISGERYALAPASDAEFRPHEFRAAFSPEDRRRIRRIQALLEIGAEDLAQCEIAELDVGDNHPQRSTMLALLQHAVGDWLEAIKTFDALPRSYRHALPGGFERLLFPRRYVDEVEGFAKSAGVDPAMVFAIIRQESVFNPRAFSPVGARGLMQLMPATAKLESRRLAKTYLPTAERRQIQALAKNKANLFKPALNVALGIHHFKTLITKYEHPVFALCAYNASPSAANRWRNTIASDDILAFVERIPYRETRGYVKLILRNYFYYKRWYGDEPGDLLHLDAVAGPLAVLTSGESESVPNH